jgi:hypothetical protein
MAPAFGSGSPFYKSQKASLLWILTDRGSEWCGRIERQEYLLYLAVNHIDHTRAEAQPPQISGKPDSSFSMGAIVDRRLRKVCGRAKEHASA